MSVLVMFSILSKSVGGNLDMYHTISHLSPHLIHARENLDWSMTTYENFQNVMVHSKINNQLVRTYASP